MAKNKLTVKTDLGTFTRSTDRTYTHIVVVKGYRAERMELRRLEEISSARQTAAKYRKAIETGTLKTFDNATVARWIASGELAQWAEEREAMVKKLEAIGPITEDCNSWQLSEVGNGQEAVAGVLGWCGRLDLARKLAATKQASWYRTVRIYDVATGNEVK